MCVCVCARVCVCVRRSVRARQTYRETEREKVCVSKIVREKERVRE